MNNTEININFSVMAIALLKHVKEKALKAGSTIVYRENGFLIKETPKNNTKTFLKGK